MAELIWRSFYVSALGVFFAGLIALPLAYFVARRRFWARGLFVALMQALMGLPPVVVGLLLYLVFRPQSILGEWGWLYGIKIMVLAQVLIVIPILFSLSFNALASNHQKLDGFLKSFPRNPMLHMRILFFESGAAILAAIFAGFGRAIGEVGAVLIVGGNIADRTEVLTTVIVEETGKGNIELATRMGLILLIVAVSVSVLAWLVGRRHYG